MELQVNKLHGVTWPCLTHTPTPPHMYLSVLTQAHVYSHRHTHTDNEKNDRWGKGQPELQLYELTTITALTELTRSEQRKITSLYGLQHIKRHTHIYTHRHTHTQTLPLALSYQGHVNHNVILYGALWKRKTERFTWRLLLPTGCEWITRHKREKNVLSDKSNYEIRIQGEQGPSSFF